MNHVNAIRCNDEYQCSHCGKSWDIHEEAPDCKMTLVSKQHRMINYFGLSLVLYPNINWLSVDANGDIYGWDNKPHINDEDGQWFIDDNGYEFIKIGKVNLHGMDWRETLRKC